MVVSAPTEVALVVAFGVAVVSWGFGLVEMVLSLALWRGVFALGPVVVVDDVDFPPPLVEVGRRYTTPSATLKLISTSELIFFPRLFAFSLSTPFPAKCRIRWDKTGGRLEGRTMLGPIGFVGASLACVVTFAVDLIVQRQDGEAVVGALFVSAFATALVVGGWYFSRGVENQRTRRIIGEIRQVLSSHNRPV